MDDQADQVVRTNGASHVATETTREAAADQSAGRAAARRFVEPATEPDEDLTEAGYGHGV